MVIPYSYLLQPVFYQGFVEGFKVGTLLFNVILQVVNSFNLRVSGNCVNSAFFTLFAELENLVGYAYVYLEFLILACTIYILAPVYWTQTDGSCYFRC